MRLRGRLTLLILACLAPVVMATFALDAARQTDRQEHGGRIALHDAASVQRQAILLAQHVSRTAAIAANAHGAAASHCTAQLDALRFAFSFVRSVAILETNGRIACAEDAAAADGRAQPAWLATAQTLKQGMIGALVSIDAPVADPDQAAPILPVAAASVAGDRLNARHTVVGLDAVGFTAAVRDAARPTGEPDAVSILTDRAGNVIGQFPTAIVRTGQPLPPPLASLIGDPAPEPRAMTVGGAEHLVAYVPAAGSAGGIGVLHLLDPSSPAAGPDAGVWTYRLAIGGAVLIALLLAWFGIQRLVARPADRLLEAARRWQDGDLHARAAGLDRDGEFAVLAQSFNAMADGLQTQEHGWRQRAELLEAEAAKRTHELSETNNRLQVEIAGRERTETVLLQAQKLQVVGQLAGGVAHDFNNMLATIMGNLELMEHRIGRAVQQWTVNDVERMARLIDRAIGAVQRGSQLTARLVAFSRRQPLLPQPTDVNALISELVTLASGSLGRRIKVEADLTPEPWLAMVDPSQLEAAILNLCLNARDAMPDGGPLVITTANIAGTECSTNDDLPIGDYVRIAVSDTGIGMVPEVQRRAFEPFFTTKGPRGSGLGLSQVFGMARQSGGAVAIDSASGQGSVVSLLLPRAVAVAEPDSTTTPGRSPSPRTSRRNSCWWWTTTTRCGW